MRKRKLQLPQKKIMLDFMGYPLGKLPKTAKELDEMLAFVKGKSPAAYSNAFDIIVNHKTPDSGIPEEMLLEKVGKIIDSETYDKVQRSLDTLDNVTKGIAANLQGKATLAIEQARKEAMEKMRIVHVKVGNKKPKKVNGVIPEYFEKMLKKAQARVNIMLVGPAGSGKTHIAGMLAEALDLDFASQSCTAGMSESALSGWLLPTGENGQFVYVSSEFVRIYENGGVFLFDEMDAADPNVLIFINQAIANGKFSLPIRHENPLVKKHPDFICVSAANTFGGGADAMYHARNALDAATLDRFKAGMIIVDYSSIVEEQLVDPAILIWGLKIRQVINRHKMKRLMSTRALLDFTKLKVEQDFTIDEINEDYFLDWSPEEKRIMDGVL